MSVEAVRAIGATVGFRAADDRTCGAARGARRRSRVPDAAARRLKVVALATHRMVVELLSRVEEQRKTTVRASQRVSCSRPVCCDVQPRQSVACLALPRVHLFPSIAPRA